MFRIVSVLFLIITAAKCKGPEVITSVGNVAGYLKTSSEGTVYSAFEGIPYAKPPVGELRFEKAQPREPWIGTWNATTLHECIQMSFSSKLSGSEDCLYLNVYVPREQPLSVEDIDVIVDIHGGGFVFGSPQAYTSPDYLMDRNVIFVSLNYRLGPFGFLSTEDDIVPGNNGLKDQNLALKWVKDNIKYFGGNPNSITLTGFSAGAASSHFHYLSPASRGLFNRGVSHSGTAISMWAMQQNGLKAAKLVSSGLGCPIQSTKELVNCLREKPANAILSATAEQAVKQNGNLQFAPVVDNDFLPKNSLQLLLENELNDVPWVFSTAAQDGLVPGFLYADILDYVEENWETIAPSLLKYYVTHPKSEWSKIAATIKEKYIGKNNKIGSETFFKFVQLLTDRFFLVDSEKAAKLQSKGSKSSVYYYFFNYKSTGLSMIELFKPDIKDEFKGIAHGDDVLRLYGNVIPNNTPNEDDKKISKILLDFLVSFARTGVPTVEGVDWKPTGHEELTYLNITSPTDISVISRKTISPVEFWEQYNIFAVNPTKKDEL